MNTKYPDNMSRDEFKSSLFQWLKDRGILSELQAFLRQQMVQKLNGVSLPRSPQRLQSPREQAFTLLICDYLKKHRLTFTLSVLAAEKRLPSHSVPSFDEVLLEETLHCLKLGVTARDVQFSVQRNQRQSVLEILFDQFEKSPSRHERNDPVTQSRLQTTAHAGVQVWERRPEFTSRSTQTDTEETLSRETIEEFHKEEIRLLKLKLEETQTAYEESQRRLHETLRSLSQLASSTVETRNHERSPDRTRTCNQTNATSDLLREAQTSRQFLDSVDSKMSTVNERLRLLTTNPPRPKSAAEIPSGASFFYPYYTGASSDVFVNSGNALSAELYGNKES